MASNASIGIDESIVCVCVYQCVMYGGVPQNVEIVFRKEIWMMENQWWV